MRFGVKSDKGMVRETNEDSCNIIAGYTGIPVCFMVADGMGGHNSGEIASKTAVDFISKYILQNSGKLIKEEDLPKVLIEMMGEANKEVYSKSKEDDAFSGMGTTLIVGVVLNKKFFVGHVGDSRVYLIRDGKIERLTTDHSFIEELVQNGTITREEAEKHPKRNIITRALGCFESIQIDTHVFNIKNEDIYLLCTDGLTNQLTEAEIKEVIEGTNDPEMVCNELVKRANERGGEDNISVIVFKDV
ncbi:MAG: Stp1/IreP family PP2C-type Ser/Thr phosphatase [Clostridia bacterium]|nr:Stp1/IreP family PP2C-type Ser/Thr phosphatase [Clostridia bacterium]